MSGAAQRNVRDGTGTRVARAKALDWLADYRKDWLRPDIVAGLITAAVVIPKAMAYATVAGLPVQAGLYTAFVPAVIYALLGNSRVLSVSTTTTIAILTGANLALVVPDGNPTALLTASATLAAMVGVLLVLASVLRLGFLATFISEPVLSGFKAGIGVVIVLDQVPKLLGVHFPKGTFLENLVALFRSLPETSRSDACARRRDDGAAARPETVRAPPARSARHRRRGHRCHGVPRSRRLWSRDRRGNSARFAQSHAARSFVARAALAGRPRHYADELHRNDGRRASVRSERGTAGTPEPRVGRDGPRHVGRRRARRHVRRRRRFPNCGEPTRRRTQPARRPGHGRRNAVDAVVPRAADQLDAASDARGGRDRLLGRADSAGRSFARSWRCDVPSSSGGLSRSPA